jgi:hypothetical protein
LTSSLAGKYITVGSFERFAIESQLAIERESYSTKRI